MPAAALRRARGEASLPAPEVPVKIGAFTTPRCCSPSAGFVLIGRADRSAGARRDPRWHRASRRPLGTRRLGPAPSPDASRSRCRSPAQFTLSPRSPFNLDVAGRADGELSAGPADARPDVVSSTRSGTLVGVGAAGNMLDKDGNFPQVEKPMLVDAVTCMFASLVGTSHERRVHRVARPGSARGARTGLAAVVTAACCSWRRCSSCRSWRRSSSLGPPTARPWWRWAC